MKAFTHSTEHLIAIQVRGDNLADDISLGEADDQTILRCVVLVLGLCDETLAGVEVGLASSATLVLHLVAAGDNVR